MYYWLIGYVCLTENIKKNRKRLMEKLGSVPCSWQGLGEYDQWCCGYGQWQGVTTVVILQRWNQWRGRLLCEKEEMLRRKRVITTFFKTSSNFNVILQNLKFWITLVILDSLKTNYMFLLLVLNQQNEDQNKDLKKNTQEFYNGMIIIQIILAYPRAKHMK